MDLRNHFVRRVEEGILAISLAVVLGWGHAASAEAARCELIRIDEWPVQSVRNHLIVDGTINGRKVGVMLDTGATRSMMLRSSAKRLDLPSSQSRTYRSFGIGGESRVDVVHLDEFRVAQAVRKGWDVLAVGEGDFGEGIDFLLGEDFFRRVDVEFDLPHGRIRLFEPRDCAGVPLAYWASDAGEVRIEAVSESQPQILLTVRINGESMPAMLDTGASRSVLSLRDAARVGLTPDAPGVASAGKAAGVGGRAADGWVGPLKSFEIGNERVADTAIYFADLWKDAAYATTDSRIPTRADSQQPMLLGVDFLRAHRILVSHSQRKLYFTYVGGPVFLPRGR